MTGTLPTELSLLKELQHFHAPANHFEGSIEDAFKGMFSLVNLTVSNNKITGSLPVDILMNNQMQRFDLSYNQITGKIPATIFTTNSLIELNLEGNLLSGGIASSVYELTKLTLLSLHDNYEIIGTISSLISQLSKLETLRLGSTQVGGSLPTELFLLSSLKMLDLSNAAFSGTLPENFLQLGSTLEDLMLDHNTFVGPIPLAFQHLTALDMLQIQSNLLSGELSSAVCTINNMQRLSTVQLDCPDIYCSCCVSCLELTEQFSDLFNAVQAQNVSDVTAFDDRNSPQFLAAEWSINTDQYWKLSNFEFEDPKFLQRLALATFYFATLGDNWSHCGRNSPTCGDVEWLSNTDECEWLNVFCNSESGLLERLSFCKSCDFMM